MPETKTTPDKTEIRSDWQLTVDVDAVLRGQGANPEKVRSRQPRLIELAERAIVLGTNWIRPQVAYRALDIREVHSGKVVLANGTELKGYGIVRRIRGLESMIAAIATVGSEFEQEFQKASKEDVALGLALDGFGTAAIGALTSEAGKFFARNFAAPRSFCTGPLFPGMRGWELAGAQSALFSLVDASAIGVSLNASFVMQPVKSVSMVIGIGQKAQCTELPCAECDSADTCLHKPAKA